MLNVHIALVGNKEKPILEGFLMYKAIDKIYLLHSLETKTVAYGIRKKISQISKIETYFQNIDPFSMESVINSIVDIGKREQKNNLFINITGGTNMMAGSACAASFFLGAQAYYILDQNKIQQIQRKQDLLIELPIPKIPHYISLEPMQQKVLQLIANKDNCDSAYVKQKLDISPQSLSYHIKELVKKNLVEARRNNLDPRKLIVQITNAGKLFAKWVESK